MMIAVIKNFMSESQKFHSTRNFTAQTLVAMFTLLHDAQWSNDAQMMVALTRKKVWNKMCYQKRSLF